MAEVSLRDRRQGLLDRPELRGREFCRAYAAEADAWLAGLADQATQGSARRLALTTYAVMKTRLGSSCHQPHPPSSCWKL